MDNINHCVWQPARAVWPRKLHLTFALPIELRKAIYYHLLTTKPILSPTTLLYHDEFHSAYRYLNLHTAILQVSRQTYADAVPILYGDNIFKIWLCGILVIFGPGMQIDLDHCLNPTGLLRRAPGSPLGSPSGLISPAALHSLCHLELDFSYDSFWGSSQRPYLTETTKLVLEILGILGRGPSPTDPAVFDDKERTLKLTIHSDYSGKCLSQSPNGTNTTRFPRAFSSFVDDIVFLLENLSHRMTVTVFEAVSPGPSWRGFANLTGPVMRQVEIRDLVVTSASE